ncbi:MAG: hypothetical protein U1E15_11150 [Hyphomicrobiales bacterium]
MTAHTSLGTARTTSPSSEFTPPTALQAQESAQYIADMVLELRNMAKSSQFKVLQGLLEITYYEAFTVAHPPVVPAGERERLEELGADAMRAESA